MLPFLLRASPQVSTTGPPFSILTNKPSSHPLLQTKPKMSAIGFSFPSVRIPTVRSSRRTRISAQHAVAGRGRGLYGMLGVEETASAVEIKAAYRSLAKRFHPDVGPDGSGSEFMEIQRAYSVLSDPQERARYDGRMTTGVAGLRVKDGVRFTRWETDQCW